MSTPSQASPEALLEHAGWIKNLARQLARGGDAEDLEQEAYLAALERPQASVESLRGWLGGVLRNRARQAAREDLNRLARERVSARPEALPSPDELLERMGAHSALVEEVTALGEPYRSVLILRFFEGLTQAEIAEREGSPVASVNSRLTRALAQLRERLDRRYDGGRTAWLSAIAPLWQVKPAPLPFVPLLGALTMSKLAVVAVGAIALVGMLAFTNRKPTELEEVELPSTRVDAALVQEPAAPAPRLEQKARTPVEAPRIPSGQSVASSEERAVAPVVGIRGRVVDLHGRPVAAARISVEKERLKLDEPVFSDGEGRFILPGETFDMSLRLHAELAGHTELLYGLHHRDGAEATIVLAPSLAIAGQVVDVDGVGVAGATVHFSPGEAWRAQLDEAIQSSVGLFLEATCDDHGRFFFEHLPRVVGAGFYAEKQMHFSERVACPEMDAEDLLIELLERERSGELVQGRVLDPAGESVPGTWIACGIAGTRTDEQGAFVLNRSELEPGFPLRAAKQGWLPVELPAPVTADAQHVGWPDQVLMRLESPSLSIGGRILDVDGTPLRNREVWLDNPTLFGIVDWTSTHIETVIAGGKGPMTFVTDEQGVFLIEGLLPRDYDLKTVDLKSMRVAYLRGVPAGSQGVVIRLPGIMEGAEVAGVVVDSEGVVQVGARVQAGVAVRAWHWPWIEGSLSESFIYGPEALTNEHGRFRLTGVPAHADRLDVAGPGMLPRTLRIAEQDDRNDLVLVVPSRREVQVEVRGGHGDATHFKLLDDSGKTLSLYSFRGGGYGSSSLGTLYEGRSPVLTVANTARTLLIMRDGEELMRKPLPPWTEGVTSVRVN